MQYQYIINPTTNKKIDIFSNAGRHLLKTYLRQFLNNQGGGASRTADAKFACRGGNEYTDYRLFVIFQTPRSVFDGLKQIRRIAGWTKRGRKLAWHWGIELRRERVKNVKSSSPKATQTAGEEAVGKTDTKYEICTMGLKKIASQQTALTTPDVYFSRRCFDGDKDKGCTLMYPTQNWSPLNDTQKAIIGKVLEQKQNEKQQRVLKLPFQFSYGAHILEQEDIFNCNKFAHHFVNNSPLLLKKIQEGVSGVQKARPSSPSVWDTAKRNMRQAMKRTKSVLKFDYRQALTQLFDTFNEMADMDNRIESSRHTAFS